MNESIRNGKKKASGASLYELIHVDLVKSKKMLDGMEQYIQFPALQGRRRKLAAVQAKVGGQQALDLSGVPALFVVHGALPLESPSMMSPSSNGPTLSAVFYFAIKQTTIDALEDLAANTAADGGAAGSGGGGGGGGSKAGGEGEAAVKLLRRFCAEADKNGKMFSRFKCIGMVRNYDQAGMPSMFRSFNGKPVLIRNMDSTKGATYHHWMEGVRRGLRDGLMDWVPC